jgi:hypothetical protein
MLFMWKVEQKRAAQQHMRARKTYCMATAAAAAAAIMSACHAIC